MGPALDIESNVDIPSETRGRKAVYPFMALADVGMSFFVPDKSSQSMGPVVAYWNKKDDGRKYKQAAAEKDGVEGVRVWRVE